VTQNDAKLDEITEALVRAAREDLARMTCAVLKHHDRCYQVHGDRLNAIAERVARFERALDAHVGDGRVHRKPRR
jgi:hypothetical protein